MPLQPQPALPVYAYPLFGRTLTTAAGTSPSTATAVTAAFTDINAGTTANGSAGVILPASMLTAAPAAYTVINFTSNPVQVYPPSGSDIIGIGSNFPYTLPAWVGAVFQNLASAPLQINVEEVYSIPVNTVPT